MKKKYTHIICTFVFLFVLPLTLMSQDYLEGQLYLNVEYESGIPDFIDNGDTIVVELDNTDIENLFNQFGVFSFDRSFPTVDSFPNNYKYDLENVYTLKCHGDEELLMTSLVASNSGLYKYVEQIPIFYPVHTPNDYHLLDPVLGNNWALDLIKAEQAWDYTHGDPNVLIGIPELGFLESHPDLINKITMINTANPPTVHGTAVAGCVGAETNNGIGISSIGYNCSLLGYNVNLSCPDWFSGLIALSQAGAKIVNASFANCEYSETFQRLIYLIRDNGTLIVSSAGNGDAIGYNCTPNSYRYPASYDGVISVSSVYHNDFHEGPGNLVHTHNDKVDVCAPGYEVISTTFDNQYQPIYYYVTGTSFASPIVAGMAGLVYSITPDAPPALVEAIIESTCDNIDNINPNYAGLLGNGRINAYEAVSTAWNISTTSTQPIIISNGQNITLEGADGIKVINEYIKVCTGGTLSIKSKLFFKENAKIMVEPGGLLIIDGGLLTTYNNTYLWEGIELWGDVNQNQFTQGAQAKIEIKNNARIEYAKIAIGTFRKYNEFLSVPSGGIIMADTAFFYNNKVCIDMRPYENHHPVSGAIFSNLSYFTNVTFNNTEYFLETFTNDAFVKLSGVRGIDIKGCDFENIFSLNSFYDTWTSELGTGIYSINSSFSVDHLCLSQQTPCIDFKPSTFNTLYYGIFAINSVTDKSFTVFNSKFGVSIQYNSAHFSEGVLKGIYASGHDNLNFSNNSFLLPLTFTTESYGTYLDNCTGYLIADNNFSLIGEAYIPSNYDNLLHGLIIDNSGVDNNEVYRNSFERLFIAIQPQNQNRGLRSGLQLKCNEFIDCIYDIGVLMDEEPLYKGIAPYQGTALEPAGNLFTEWSQNEYHIYNEGDPLTYCYHNNPQVYPVEPVEISSNVTASVGDSPYDPLTSCPDNSGGGLSGSESMLAEFEELSSEKDILEQVYNALVDDGNTSDLENQVEMAVSATANAIKEELLDISPFVSDSVLKTSVVNEDAIDNNILKDVMIENPHSAKSEDILFSLLERSTPMPDEMMAEILNGRFTLSEMEMLAFNINQLDIKKQKTLNLVLNHYMTNNIDSAKILLENEGTLATTYKLAMLHFEDGNLAQATALLSVIPTQFVLTTEEANEYADYISLTNILSTTGQFTYQPDSLQLTALTGFLGQASGRPATFARNMLISAKVINYDEPILKPSPFKSTGFPYDRFETISCNSTIERINIFPNPARKSISIECLIDETINVLQMDICSLAGKIVKVVPLYNVNGQNIIDVSDINPGVYVCKIIGYGKTLKTEKLTIIH